jgi:hypothetical protein
MRSEVGNADISEDGGWIFVWTEHVEWVERRKPQGEKCINHG